MTEVPSTRAATFHVKILQNTVQVCTDDQLITTQRFDVCGDREACLEAVDVAVDALRAAAREVVNLSWRFHLLERTNGLHA